MALTTRWLAIGTGALLVLVGVVVLPPRPCESANIVCSGWSSLSASTQPAVAERTRDRLRQALERRQLADSILTQASARRRITSVAGITVHFEAPLSADSARRWLALAERELMMIPGDGHGVPVHVVLRTASSRAAPPDTTTRRWWYNPPLDRFATSAGGGACLVVIDLREHGDVLLRAARPRLIDWCALYGRFGTPSPIVENWAAPAFSLGWRDQGSLAEMAAVARADSSREDEDYRIHACRVSAGRPCLEYLGVSPGLIWRFAQRERARDLLAWLLATSDPAQFAGFWQARGSLEEALTSGYSRPAGVVLQAWAQARFAGAPRRPTAAPKALLAGTFWLSLAMVAALLAMERRQTD